MKITWIKFDQLENFTNENVSDNKVVLSAHAKVKKPEGVFVELLGNKTVGLWTRWKFVETFFSGKFCRAIPTGI